MTTINVDLAPGLLGKLSSTAKAWAVYFDANGNNPEWYELTAATTPLTFTGQHLGLKIYFILQSMSPGVKAVHTPLSAGNPHPGNPIDPIKTEADIVPTGPSSAADTLNYRYDSFEVTFKPDPADAGNLTDINGFGIPMAVEVVYDSSTPPNTSASRGYNLSGGGIWNELASSSAGGAGSIQYYASGGGFTGPRFGISPAAAIGNQMGGTNYSAGDWTPYITSLTSGGATSAGDPNQIQIAGYFNGGNDVNHIYHNAGFYAYDVTYDGTNFKLTPGSASQIKGTITISPDDLANSIYMTLGNVKVDGLANGNGTANDAILPMNTGANNEWGAVLRDFVAAFAAGYWNGMGTPLNPAVAVTPTLNLNKEWNQDPTYAFGGRGASGPGAVTHSGTVVYDEYAKVFFNATNSYGNGYSDFLTRAYNVGPLINVSDGATYPPPPPPPVYHDSSDITVTLFADDEAPTGYTPQVINNYLNSSGGSTVSSGGYLVPSGPNTHGITTQLNFNVGTTSLKPDTPVTLILKGSGGSEARVPLVHSGAYAGNNYRIVSGGSGYSANFAGSGTAGFINIVDVPVASATSSASVIWYQIEVGSGTAQKIFNLYETVDTSGQILNPAYAGQAAALSIDGLAVATGNGTGQYIADRTGQVTINFQAGGNNTLDPSLMAVVPLPSSASSSKPPLGGYAEPTAPLVGMRPGYTSGAGAPFLESYQVWSAQYTSTVSSGTGPSAVSWTVQEAHPQTVYNGGLVFGWNGADSAALQQQTAVSNYYVGALTNKIGGGAVARLSFTSVSGAALPSEIVTSGGYLTATADADGNWATSAPVSFGNGTYTVQMQEFLSTDLTFARAVNSSSAVQSFTVAQGAVISDYNLSVDTTIIGLTVTTNGVSSGTVTVNSSGTASATMISAGGTMQMAHGSGDTGSIVLGAHTVWSGASASNTTVARGGHDYVYGTTSAASINGSGVQVVGGGGYATNAIANGTTLNSGSHQHVKSAGSATNTLVLGGAVQVVDSGGLATNTSVYASGTLHVSSGGIASGTIMSGGLIGVFSGGVTVGAMFQGIGGLEIVASGGIASATTLQSGNSLYVAGGGSATGATVQNGGHLYAYGGFSIGATVQTGGIEDVQGIGAIATGATVQSAGYEFIHDGASALNANLQSDGNQWVWGSGTTATGTTIGSGAELVVHRSGVASSIVVNSGGSAAIISGGIVSGATLNGGTLEIGSNSFASGTITIGTSGGTVKLDDSQHLDSSSYVIAGLTPTAGAIDFADIDYTAGSTTVAWVSAGIGTSSGTLTLTSAAVHASVILFGNYLGSKVFHLASDGHGGTLVTDPVVGNDSQNLLTLPHG